MAEPDWLTLARADIGIAEISGPEANPKIMQYYKAAHADWAKNDNVPWCGAACAAWVSGAGHAVPAEAARARAWLEWGEPCDPPKPGAIAVFRRGTDPTLGHVALFLGESGDRITVLGGNQGDAVSITTYPKAMLLGTRWPSGAAPYEEPMPMLVIPDKPLTKSTTIWAGFAGMWASVMSFFSDAGQWLTEWATALTDMAPLKVALMSTGANIKAVALGIAVWAAFTVWTARTKAKVSGVAG